MRQRTDRTIADVLGIVLARGVFELSAGQNPKLESLLSLFYDSVSDRCAEFVEVPAEAVPDPYHNLLVHSDHMTVTVEAFHESLVDVRVLEVREEEIEYARKILLTRKSDEDPVLFGIVRIHFKHLDESVREEIRGRRTPLGRILINHNVMRYVQPLSYWAIKAGEDLAKYLNLKIGDTTYGRTAIIYCDEEPAIELLEVVV